MIIIFIHNMSLSTNKDFLFESAKKNIIFFAHIIDNFITTIIIKNDFSKFIKISRNDQLKIIIKIQYLNVFHVDLDQITNYVEKKSRDVYKVSWFSRILKTAIIVYTIISTVSSSILEYSHALIFKSQDVIFINDVIIHNFISDAVICFFKIINEYSDLWKSDEFVKLLMNQWMRISLRFDWETKISKKVKIYSLNLKDKKLVDQTFDDLHQKNDWNSLGWS